MATPPSTKGNRVLDEERDYQRILPDADSRQALRERGMSWVLSSNVSAIGTQGGDLYVRFHNGSIYKYFNKADMFNAMYESSSKGRFVWNKLRRPNVPYTKVGSMPLKEDRDVSDEAIMRVGISTQKVKKLNALSFANMAKMKALADVSLIEATASATIPLLK
jgi:hypothetical protein